MPTNQSLKIQDLQNKQVELVIQSQEIINSAKAAGRDITDAEAVEVNKLLNKSDMIAVELKVLGLEDDDLPSRGRKSDPQPINGGRMVPRGDGGQPRKGLRTTRGNVRQCIE